MKHLLFSCSGLSRRPCHLCRIFYHHLLFLSNPSDFTWDIVEQHLEIKKNESAVVHIKGFIFYNLHFSILSSSGVISEGSESFERKKPVELVQKLFFECGNLLWALSSFKTTESGGARKYSGGGLLYPLYKSLLGAGNLDLTRQGCTYPVAHLKNNHILTLPVDVLNENLERGCKTSYQKS